MGELKNIFPPFEVLGNEAEEKLELQVKCFSYKKKQIIYRDGFSPTGLFIIKKGKIKIYKINDSAKEIIIQILGAKEMIGFSALVRNSEYHYWAETIADCELIFVPKRIFNELTESYPKLFVSLMLSFFKEFDDVIDKMVDIVSDQVRKRTAKALLWLAETNGFEEDKKTIGLSLSREDLAHLVASNMETIVRTLSDFKKEKIISMQGKKITINNLEKLHKIVSLA